MNENEQTATPTVPEHTIEFRKKAAETEILAVLQKYGVKPQITMTFPMFNYYPDDLSLALAIINKYDRVFKVEYVEGEEGKK